MKDYTFHYCYLVMMHATSMIFMGSKIFWHIREMIQLFLFVVLCFQQEDETQIQV